MSEPRRRDVPSLGRSLVDPVVVAAFVGMVGAVIGALVTYWGTPRIAQPDPRCDRAFAFLQDESVNPRLENDNGFYRMQIGIAVQCSRSAER